MARTAINMTCMCLFVMSISLAGGCEKRTVGTKWGSFRSSGDWGDTDNQLKRSSSGSTSEGMWAISLGRYDGPNHKTAAAKRRKQLVKATGLSDVWVSDENDHSLMYYGRYKSPSDRHAQADLLRWQRLRQSGRVRLPVLMLTPLVTEKIGSMPKYELGTAKKRGVYTLQIGVYEGKGREQAAEKWVRELRRENVEAFYYHGPNRSMVTIGVFGDQDVRGLPSGQVEYSYRIKELQQKFPYNMANGRTIREKRPKGPQRNQPSFIVRIPGSGF